MRQRLTLTILLVSTLLGACGTRGPLTLPQPPKESVASNATRPTTLTSIDLNTAKVRS